MLSFNRAQQHYDNMSPEDVGGNVEAGEEEDAAEDDTTYSLGDEDKNDEGYSLTLESAYARIKVLNETRNEVIAERDMLREKLDKLESLLGELRDSYSRYLQEESA